MLEVDSPAQGHLENIGEPGTQEPSPEGPEFSSPPTTGPEGSLGPRARASADPAQRDWQPARRGKPRRAGGSEMTNAQGPRRADQGPRHPARLPPKPS